MMRNPLLSILRHCKQGRTQDSPLPARWEQVLALLVAGVCLSGCGIKMAQLPAIEYPYVAEIEFLKEVKNIDGKAKKKRFKQNRITSPFYFFLKIKEIENNGTVRVAFYGTGNTSDNTLAAEKQFNFGQPGKYYEHIIFFDQVKGLKEGKYRYAIFYNDRLIYEDKIEILSSH
ncbi:MAG: hypothetical protein GY940_20085 [bacterium]|nr:hypothetical protein [bacterium]